MITQLLAFFLLSLGASAGGLQEEEVAATFWRDARNCGANSLYMLLRAHDLEVDYEELINAPSYSERGLSLIQLRDLSSDLGLETQVLKSSPGAFESLELPVIAHMESFTNDIGGVGHFIVVYEWDAVHGKVSAFDGTTASNLTMSKQKFKESWSGYVLAPVQEGTRTLDLFGYAALSMGLIASFVLIKK